MYETVEAVDMIETAQSVDAITVPAVFPYSTVAPLIVVGLK